MAGLGEMPLLFTLLALAIIVVLARGAGDIAKRLGQPEVVGEFVVGFLIGPSVLGIVLPGIHATLFLSQPVDLVLSGFSWIGAILLLFIAGLEVDLGILRAEVRAGALAAALAIVPSVLTGTAFSLIVLGRPLAYAFFLGIVLSVTAVSVAAKILIEREMLRRRYAQVILAAGIASEVLVWLMVSVVSAAHENSPALAIRSGLFAVGFFIFMLTVGRRFVFWAMRRVADSSRATKGQFSLVLALMLFSAVLTQAMGLHPLLGAFVFGVLLSRAPRTNRPLVESVQTITTGFFAPIFFVLAGMRVDLPQVGGIGAIGVIALLLVAATLVKVGLSALGARLGGLGGREAALVGVGLNMKGGTDVIVAIVGVELGLMSGRVYTLYAIVAILTVFLSPAALTYLERRTPPSTGEQERLAREEAGRRGYASRIERVLVPTTPQLLPALSSSVVEAIANAKATQDEIFDITSFVASETEEAFQPEPVVAAVEKINAMDESHRLKNVEVVRQRVDTRHTLRPVLEASKDYDLLAIGSCPTAHRSTIAFGRLQDAIIQRAQTDVLLTCDRSESLDLGRVKRILVPTNGQEYSLAAGDIAAYLARVCDAELVLFHMVTMEMDALFWREYDSRRVKQVGFTVVDELAFRCRRLDVRATGKVEPGTQPGEAVLRELERDAYDLVVMGGYKRGTSGRPYLGGAIRTVLAKNEIPAVILVSRMVPLRG